MGDGSGDISWLEFNNDRLAMIFDGAGNYFPKTEVPTKFDRFKMKVNN